MPTLFALREKWMSVMTTRHKLIPLSIIRILYGLLMLIYFVRLFPDRDFLFSNAVGYYPTDYISTKSDVLRHWLLLFDSYRFIDTLFLVGLISAFTFMIGFQTKLSNALLYGAYFLLEGRNPLLFDAGDDFVQLSLLYLFFCQLNAHFSIDRLLARRPRKENEYVTIIHNLGVTAVIIQFLFIYVVSGIAKVSGHQWRDGTALYYVSQIDFYTMIDSIGGLIVSHPWLSAVLTYAVLIFQLVFPIFVFMKRTRTRMLLIAFCFHLGIAVQFGLPYFSLIMMGFEAMFFSDEEWRRAISRCSRSR